MGSVSRCRRRPRASKALLWPRRSSPGAARSKVPAPPPSVRRFRRRRRRPARARFERSSRSDELELDALALGGVRRVSALPGLHHARVWRRGRPVFATFFEVVPGQSSLELPAQRSCRATARTSKAQPSRALRSASRVSVGRKSEPRNEASAWRSANGSAAARSFIGSAELRRPSRPSASRALGSRLGRASR